MPTMDYSKLRGRIKEKGMTQKSLAHMIGLSEGQMCQKLQRNYFFKQSEIRAICAVLEIPAAEIGEYFFSPES